MSFPTQKQIEVPLLQVLAQLGGAAKPQQVYPRVAEFFPELTKEDLDERLPSNSTTVKWWNLVQWARQRLVEDGGIDGSTRGVWKLTDKGRGMLGSAAPNHVKTEAVAQRVHANLKDLVYENRQAMVKRIITELNGLTPGGFEHFCLSLLEGLGYESVMVTGKSGDGGIDGYGDYRQGIVKIKSAFQAKRWKQTPVGRPEIDKFRGAIQGDYDHGLFLTTNTITKDAQQASVKKGAITVLLLDGNAIANHMISSGIGVRKEPVFLMDVDDDFFTFERDRTGGSGQVGI
jgi:restriction system protein